MSTATGAKPAAHPLRSVCVFCGSNPGLRPEYARAAEALGGAIAARGMRLVYGGGSVGLMGIVARAALAAGGEVTGVIPRALLRRELEQKGLTEMHVVESMHERKAMMAESSDAFIALPGGYGTLEEFCEVLTWSQLGFHAKPVALLNIGGFYDPLLALFDHCVSEGFVRPPHREIVITARTPQEVLDALGRYVPPVIEKWIGLDQN